MGGDDGSRGRGVAPLDPNNLKGGDDDEREN